MYAGECVCADKSMYVVVCSGTSCYAVYVCYDTPSFFLEDTFD
jgi:hypothetical protein